MEIFQSPDPADLRPLEVYFSNILFPLLGFQINTRSLIGRQDEAI